MTFNSLGTATAPRTTAGSDLANGATLGRDDR